MIPSLNMKVHAKIPGVVLITIMLNLDTVKALRWRCAELMRFITLQVALFSSNGILYRRAPVCILFVYR